MNQNLYLPYLKRRLLTQIGHAFTTHNALATAHAGNTNFEASGAVATHNALATAHAGNTNFEASGAVATHNALAVNPGTTH